MRETNRRSGGIMSPYSTRAPACRPCSRKHGHGSSCRACGIPGPLHNRFREFRHRSRDSVGTVETGTDRQRHVRSSNAGSRRCASGRILYPEREPNALLFPREGVRRKADSYCRRTVCWDYLLRSRIYRDDDRPGFSSSRAAKPMLRVRG